MQQVVTNTASSPSPGAWPSELAGAGKVEAGRGLAGAGWLLATASSGKAAPGSWVGGGGEGEEAGEVEDELRACEGEGRAKGGPAEGEEADDGDGGGGG